MSPAIPWLRLPAQGDWLWLLIGLGGQAMFTMRFVVQWLHSERAGRSLIPASFWMLSLAGGLAVLAYGLHRGDPVIIMGQLPGAAIYVRNLILVRRPIASGAT